jgi:hypothetical protein
MIAINHTLTGAAIGSVSDNIPLVIVLSIASHFVLDFLPHVDQGADRNERERFRPLIKYSLAAFDVFISLIIIILLIYFKSSLNGLSVFIGALSALSIDLIFNVPFWEKKVASVWPLNKIYDFHNKLHGPFKKYEWWGIPIQILLVIICLWVILR